MSADAGRIGAETDEHAGLSLEFTVRSEPADVLRYVLGRLYRRRVVVSLLSISLLALAALVWLALRSPGSLTAVLPAAGLILVLPVLLLALLPVLVWFHVRRAFRKGELGAPTRWSVTRQGITLHSGGRSSRIGWDEIQGCLETSRVLVLDWQGGALMVPLRELSGAEREQQLRRLLKDRLGPRARLRGT